MNVYVEHDDVSDWRELVLKYLPGGVDKDEIPADPESGIQWLLSEDVMHADEKDGDVDVVIGITTDCDVVVRDYLGYVTAGSDRDVTLKDLRTYYCRREMSEEEMKILKEKEQATRREKKSRPLKLLNEMCKGRELRNYKNAANVMKWCSERVYQSPPTETQSLFAAKLDSVVKDDSKTVIILDAPPGAGKTLCESFSALYLSKNNGNKPVLIATSLKAVSEQIAKTTSALSADYTSPLRVKRVDGGAPEASKTVYFQKSVFGKYCISGKILARQAGMSEVELAERIMGISAYKKDIDYTSVFKSQDVEGRVSSNCVVGTFETILTILLSLCRKDSAGSIAGIVIDEWHECFEASKYGGDRFETTQFLLMLSRFICTRNKIPLILASGTARVTPESSNDMYAGLLMDPWVDIVFQRHDFSGVILPQIDIHEKPSTLLRDIFTHLGTRGTPTNGWCLIPLALRELYRQKRINDNVLISALVMISQWALTKEDYSMLVFCNDKEGMYYWMIAIAMCVSDSGGVFNRDMYNRALPYYSDELMMAGTHVERLVQRHLPTLGSFLFQRPTVDLFNGSLDKYTPTDRDGNPTFSAWLNLALGYGIVTVNSDLTPSNIVNLLEDQKHPRVIISTQRLGVGVDIHTIGPTVVLPTRHTPTPSSVKQWLGRAFRDKLGNFGCSFASFRVEEGSFSGPQRLMELFENPVQRLLSQPDMIKARSFPSLAEFNPRNYLPVVFASVSDLPRSHIIFEYNSVDRALDGEIPFTFYLKKTGTTIPEVFRDVACTVLKIFNTPDVLDNESFVGVAYAFSAGVSISPSMKYIEDFHKCGATINTSSPSGRFILSVDVIKRAAESLAGVITNSIMLLDLIILLSVISSNSKIITTQHNIIARQCRSFEENIRPIELFASGFCDTTWQAVSRSDRRYPETKVGPCGLSALYKRREIKPVPVYSPTSGNHINITAVNIHTNQIEWSNNKATVCSEYTPQIEFIAAVRHHIMTSDNVKADFMRIFLQVGPARSPIVDSLSRGIDILMRASSLSSDDKESVRAIGSPFLCLILEVSERWRRNFNIQSSSTSPKDVICNATKWLGDAFGIDKESAQSILPRIKGSENV